MGTHCLYRKVILNSYYHKKVPFIFNIIFQTRGFFRGLSWPLCSYGLVNSAFFGTYTSTLRILGCHSVPGHAPELLPIVVAGGVGGVVQLFVSVPVEVIKVVLQSQIRDASRQKAKFGMYSL